MIEARRPLDSKELYGRFVLQVEEARTSAGSFFRAVQLGDSGYEKHVQLFRSEPMAPEALRLVAEGLKLGLLVQHAQVIRGFDSGNVDKTTFATYEIIEGRSAGALMERSQSEGHPFAADHALLIASKVAAALEAAQARKQVHGFLVPEFVQVSYDGEVSVRGFGLPPRALRVANCVGVREAAFLAPEVETTAPLDIRADVFSLGAQLFEMLTGGPLPRNQPTFASVQAARTHVPGTDGDPLPKALSALLAQALAEDPAARFKDAAAFRKSVDTLLFSGDYSPTTFNLAFFMHTLFRDEGDEDAARIKAERNADYRPYHAARSTGAGTVGIQARVPPVASLRSSAPLPPQTPTAPAAPVPTSVTKSEAISRAEPPRTESTRAERLRGDTGQTARGPVVPPPHESEDHIFPTGMTEKKPFPVAPVAIAVVVVVAVAAYVLTAMRPEPPKPPRVNAAAVAALARVRELESRLAALETEKLAAEQKATEDATKMIEAQAKARGRAVDPAELQKAQEAARRRAQIEQDALLAAERQKIEEERKRARDAEDAALQTAAETTPGPARAAASPPVPEATAPVVAVPPLAPPPPPQNKAAGSAGVAAAAAAVPVASAPAADAGPVLLELGAPGVVAPELISQPRISYPPMARAQRLTGSVVISALVNEKGNVSETRMIRGASSANAGFDQAALTSVKKRKYKPATLNGKPGSVWVTIQIDFKL